MSLIAVITNNGSTRNLRGDNWIDPILAGEPDLLHFRIDHIDAVADTVRQCAAAGAETIVVNGGDGTAGLIFAALLNGTAYQTLPAVALLPAGKTNMTTAGWSLTGTPEAALTALLRARRAGQLARYVVTRPVLTLRQSDSTPPLYGAFFGAADVVEGIRFCRRYIYPLKMPNVLSHVTAIAVLLWRSLRGLGNHDTVAIYENDRAFEHGQFFVVAVTALDELLLGITLAPKTSAGSLYYASVRSGVMAVLRLLPNILQRRIMTGAGRTVQRMERLTLTFTGSYTLDGELYEARAEQPLVLDGSSSLRFIRVPA